MKDRWVGKTWWLRTKSQNLCPECYFECEHVEMVAVVGDLESDLSQMQSSFTHSWGMIKDEISPIYTGICEELMEISCKNKESGGNFTVAVRRVTQRSTCQVWSIFCLDDWKIAECRQMSTFCEPPSGVWSLVDFLRFGRGPPQRVKIPENLCIYRQ